jgi:hypothetical protein
LDIDFALLLPLTLLFIWLYLRLEASGRRWLWLAPLFAVLLWAKMTNPLPLPIVLAIWQVLRGRPLRAVLHAAAIGIGGAALFAGSWVAIGRWLGFPLDMPFGVNLAQWQDSADVARRAYTSPGAFIEGLQPTVIWLGPGLVSLGLVAVALRGGQLARCWNVKRADLLIGVAAVLVLGYVNKSAGWFPKYQVALAPLLACLAATLLAYLWCGRPLVVSTLVPRGRGSSIRDFLSEKSQPTLEAFTPRARVTAVVVVSTAAAAAITLVLIRDQWALDRSWSIAPVAGSWLLAVLVIGAASGTWRHLIGPSSAAALLGIALGWSLGVDAVQYRASYQTDYWYGTTGTVAATQWIDAHLAPDQTYVSAKEVAIRSRDQRYVDQDNFVYLLSIGRTFDGMWAGERLQAVVSWQREPYVADLFNRVLPAAGFVEAERFGDYVVYVPTS